jgi:hypothetical protein
MVNKCYQLSRYTSRSLTTANTFYKQNQTNIQMLTKSDLHYSLHRSDTTQFTRSVPAHQWKYDTSTFGEFTYHQDEGKRFLQNTSLYLPTYEQSLSPRPQPWHSLHSDACNLHFLHTICSVDTTTTQPNQFSCTFCPLHLLFLTLTVHASADPLTVYKPSPCWDPTAYVTNRVHCIMLSYFVSVSENSQTATQISQNMQQPHSTGQNTENCVISVLRIRDIKHTVKTGCQALMMVAI